MDIIKELESAGIKTLDTADEGYETEVFGQKVVLPSEPEGIIEAETVYNGNPGFMTLKMRGFEAVILKGVYKDFIRAKIKFPLNERNLVKVSETAASVERNLGKQMRIGIAQTDETVFRVFFAEEIPEPPRKLDSRSREPINALSAVEYTLSREAVVPEKTLYSRGSLSAIFPETFSGFAASAAKRVPSLFNPLFMSANIKNTTPSLKLIFNKPYTNMANVESVTSTLETTTDFYFYNYAPWVYLKKNKTNFHPPKLSFFGIKEDEVAETIDELKNMAGEISHQDIFEDEFTELLALTAMAFQMVQLKLWQGFTRMLSHTGSMETAMRFAYKTRNASVLEESFKAAPFIDPILEENEYPGISFERTGFDELFSEFSMAKRMRIKKKRMQVELDELQRYLGLRDEAFKAAYTLNHAVREALLIFGEELTEGRILKRREDVFLFDIEELNNFRKDEYYGNIPITLSFKKWQNGRCSSQLTPYEIYEKDLERSPEIMEAYLAKQTGEFSPLSFFHRDMEADVPGEAAAVRTVPLPLMHTMTDKKCIIAETAPVFGHLAEYCTVTDTPLYTGIRPAEILLSGKRIRTEEGKIRVI
ncbi:hypothetical protein [Limisalsivibrio acetivorans]|uniref:hypothetical protein n=1 Tax=Limisalsivibrio acetivorans TaxID=1304888 RepID=UPI00138AE857|nr:hypothetical protein [Limisalsivibrio acetivorans]